MTASMTIRITDSTEHVLDVLHTGRATAGYIADETGLSRQTVHNQLNQLLAAEHVQYVHDPTGLYELVDDPRTDTTTDTTDGIDELRGRLQDAHEDRDDARAALDRIRSERDDLQAQLEDCRERLNAADGGGDVNAAVGMLDRALTDLPGDVPGRAAVEDAHTTLEATDE